MCGCQDLLHEEWKWAVGEGVPARVKLSFLNLFTFVLPGDTDCLAGMVRFKAPSSPQVRPLYLYEYKTSCVRESEDHEGRREW